MAEWGIKCNIGKRVDEVEGEQWRGGPPVTDVVEGLLRGILSCRYDVAEGLLQRYHECPTAGASEGPLQGHPSPGYRRPFNQCAVLLYLATPPSDCRG
jgi:hypothetical protein